MFYQCIPQHNTNKCEHQRTNKMLFGWKFNKNERKTTKLSPHHTIRYQKTLWWKMKTKNQLP